MELISLVLNLVLIGMPSIRKLAQLKNKIIPYEF